MSAKKHIHVIRLSIVISHVRTAVINVMASELERKINKGLPSYPATISSAKIQKMLEQES